MNDWRLCLAACLALHVVFFFLRFSPKELLNFSTYTAVCRTKIQLNNLMIVLGMAVCDRAPGAPGSRYSAEALSLVVCFSAVFYGGGVYVMNAISDYEDDLKEKPHRPLCVGAFAHGHAIAFSCANFAIGGIYGYAVGGWRVAGILSAFFVANVIYSFGLRAMKSPILPCAFITVTSPLRLYLGAVLAGGSLPPEILGMAYLIYLAMQYTRKLIMQKPDPKDQPSNAVVWTSFALFVCASAVGAGRLDVPGNAKHTMFLTAYIVSGINYVLFGILSSTRGILAAQLQT